MSGEYKKQKEKLLLLIDELDIKAEMVPLSVAERAAKKEADDYMLNLDGMKSQNGLNVLC